MKRAIIPLILISSTTAYADTFNQPSHRQGKWEFGLLINQLDSWEVAGRSGSGIDVDNDTGWGVTFGYHYNDNFSMSFDMTFNEQPYEAQIVPDEVNAEPITIDHKMTVNGFDFNFNYYFLDKTFTPFVTGNVGWTYLDSNISNSDVEAACWWDPWWGYVCAPYYSTYSDTSFTYGIGGGLRWEFGYNTALQAGIYQKWMDVDGVHDTPEVLVGKIGIVWMQ